MVHWRTRSEMLYWQFAYVVFRKYTKLFKIKQVDQVLMTVSLKEWDTFLHLDFHDCSDKGPRALIILGKKTYVVFFHKQRQWIIEMKFVWSKNLSTKFQTCNNCCLSDL
jgi:hypothetical protein